MGAALVGLSAAAAASGLYAASAFLPLREWRAEAGRADWRPPSLAALEPLPSTPPGADDETLNRPLFSRTRRPDPASQSVGSLNKPGESASGLSISLAAIALFGGARRAYVTGDNGADGQWYRVGERVAGWVVSEIRPNELMLKSGERSAHLSLYPERQASEEAEAWDPPPPSRPRAPRSRQRRRS